LTGWNGALRLNRTEKRQKFRRVADGSFRRVKARSTSGREATPKRPRVGPNFRSIGLNFAPVDQTLALVHQMDAREKRRGDPKV